MRPSDPTVMSAFVYDPGATLVGAIAIVPKDVIGFGVKTIPLPWLS
jgi:hypothetical protein